MQNNRLAGPGPIPAIRSHNALGLLVLPLCMVVLRTMPAHSANATQDPASILHLIRDSFLHQRSLFHNARFAADYITPYRRMLDQQAKPPEYADAPGTKSILHQQYQLNRDGKFILTTSVFQSDESLKQKKLELGTQTLSFNGELYYCDSRPDSGEAGLGSIFTPQQPFDYSKPMIKPTFFMDHVFNDRIMKILDDPTNVEMTPTSTGMWQLKYRQPDSDDFYDLLLDPKQDFMIVKMSGYWGDAKTFDKTMQYASTDQGFYYLKRATLTVGDAEPAVMEVTEFLLNGPEGDYTIQFPVGTRMTDHSKGFPQIYYEGQPGKTAEETGDPSIYATADQLNRFEMYDPDVLIKRATQPQPPATEKPQPRPAQPMFRSAKNVYPHTQDLAGRTGRIRYPALCTGIAVMAAGLYVVASRRN